MNTEKSTTTPADSYVPSDGPERFEPELIHLAAVSQWAGSDPLVSQAGGGNASCKTAALDYMLIKASGYRLAQVTQRAGWIAVRLRTLLALLRDRSLAAMSAPTARERFLAEVNATLAARGERPSLEACFHATLGRVVLHTHPVYVNAFACMKDGDVALEEALGRSVPWIPYAPPGYSLGKAMDELRQQLDLERPLSAILKNHGLVVSAPDHTAAIQETQAMIAAGERFFESLPNDFLERDVTSSATANLLSEAQSVISTYDVFIRPALNRGLSRTAEACAENTSWTPLAPDDVVYNGPCVHIYRDREAFLEGLASRDFPLRKAVVLVRGVGPLFFGPSEKAIDAMEETLTAHVAIRTLIMRRGSAQELPPEEAAVIDSMEGEAHRQRIAQEI